MDNNKGISLTPNQQYKKAKVNAAIAYFNEIHTLVVTRVIDVEEIYPEVIKTMENLNTKFGQPVELKSQHQVKEFLNEKRRQQIDYENRKWANNRRVYYDKILL